MKKLLRLISVATILLAATSFMACSSDDDDDSSGARSVSARNSGSIVGVVLDNKGEPVEGATVTLGGKTAKTNYGGEFEITGVSPNDTALIKAAVNYTSTTTALGNGSSGVDGVSKTETSTGTAATTKVGTGDSNTSAAYKLTAKKDGYLSAVVTGIYVTYNNTEDPKDSRKNALLHGLQYDYQGILDKYAESVGKASGAVGTTATTTTTATEDTTATTTVQTGSNADRVFKDVSEALKGLEEKYGADYYTEYFSDFATAVMVKCDASLKGKIKLNLKTEGATTYDGKTYVPASKPVVHVSAAGKSLDSNVTAADYTWSATADENGVFEFKECLPTGIDLTITIDQFEEKITKEGATEAEAYWFSSASSIVYAENTDTKITNTAEGTSTVESISTIKLGSKDANEKSYLIMLFAQNDKVWVTKTNVEDKSSGVLLTKNDPLTFTFNKPMVKVEATGTGFGNLSKDAYTATFSEDKKTVTFTPNIGYWILTTLASNAKTQTVELSVEAEDGATTLLRKKFDVYFDNKVWVSVKDLSYDDYNDLRKLSDPIVLVFSKPMNEKIAVNLTNNKTAYTEDWNEDKTELTLKPDTKVGYWDLDSGKDNIEVRIVKDFANSKDTYIDEFDYWKVGAVAATTGTNATTAHIKVYFDAYNDVTIAKAEGAGFTATFAKAIKAQTESELKANLHVYNADTSYSETFAWGSATELSDVILALSDDGTTITVTPQNTEFAEYGYYALKFDENKFVAKTGEKILRKPATTKTVEDFTAKTTPFVTTFTLGTEFKYTDVKVVEKLPETAIASRAIYVDNDKYIQITFNKAVRTSKLTIGSATVTNYIDGKDVYLPLATIDNNTDVKLAGDVWSKDGQKWNLGNVKNATVFNTLFVVNKLSYKMVKTSLYELKASIAGVKNDALVEKIAPGDTFTFEFDQDVSKATWTAELYDKDNVGVKNLDQTKYVATPVADGKVVTVTLSGKALDFGETYYLSLKATKGEGDDVVVLYDSSAAKVETTGTPSLANDDNYGYIPNSKIVRLNTKIMELKNSNKPYIKVQVKSEDEIAGLDNLYVVEASNNKASDTTSFDEFKKSNTGKIVLEFSQDITGFTAVLAKDSLYRTTDTVGSSTNWLTTDDVEAKNTFASTSAVDDNKKNVLTITPKFAFPSGSKVYPIVFNKDGKRIDLKKVSDVNDATFVSNTKYYESLSWTANSAAENKVIESTADSTVKKLEFAVFNRKGIGNGTALYFQFDPIISETDTTANYGKYTLYRKVTEASSAATKWIKAGEWAVGGTGSVNALKSVDGNAADTAKNDKKLQSLSKTAAVAQDFGVRGLKAAIVTKTRADEFDYALTSKYKLVCNIDNVEIYSKEVTITDEIVELPENATLATGTLSSFTAATEAKVNADDVVVTYTVDANIYLLSCTPQTAAGSGTATPSDDRITKENKVTVDIVDKPESSVGAKDGVTRGRIKITITNGAKACAGDTITLTAKDAQGRSGTVVIKF